MMTETVETGTSSDTGTTEIGFWSVGEGECLPGDDSESNRIC